MVLNFYRNTLLLVITVVLIMSTAKLEAQSSFDQGLDKQKANFYEIQKSFKDYWKDKDYTEKGKGWKPFKRWEWFWEQRVHPIGEFPSPDQNMIESNKIRSNKANKNKLQQVGTWVSLGPTTNGGGYGGLGRVNVVKEDPNNSSVLWAGSASGGLWKSTNGGLNWSTNTDYLGVLGVSDIAFHPTNSSTMYIATGDGDAADNYSIGVLKSTDAGVTWNTTGLNWTEGNQRRLSKLLINPSNPNYMITGGNSGIWRSTDGGTTWSQVFTGSIRDLEFKPNDPSVVYAGRYGSTVQVIKSTDNGATWVNLTSGLPASGVNRVALGVTPINPNCVYAFLSKSSDSGFYGLYRSTDGGATWTLMSSTPNILGYNTNGSDAGGQGWYDLCMAVSQTNENEIYCGGVNLWKSTNGGTNWINLSNWTSTVHADQHDLWIAPGSGRIYAGNDGGVYKSTNAGTNWSWLGSGLQITQFYRLGSAATNSNLVIGGTQDNGTKLLSNGSWKDEVGGDGMESLIDHTNPNNMYAELYYGQVRKSTNAGSTWASMTLPAEYNSGYGSWVTPYVMHPTNASTLYIGYRNVFKSTNGGTNWTQISNFTSGSLTVLHVAPSNANYIYAATGSSGVLQRTTDGGTTWSALTLPITNYLTYMAIHSTNPLKIWATFSGYTADKKVYESTDGGATWTNISGVGQLPNVSVNSIVYQSDYNNRLYVGTDIGVFYKDDISNAWVDFSNNLPNVIVNELEINYAAKKLFVATYGRGMWSTDIPSNSLTLIAPTLITPANNSINVSINPTLKWSKVTDATSYNFQYSVNADMSVATQVEVIDTSYSLTQLPEGKIYYWRAQAKNGSTLSSWSGIWNFKTEILSLATPSLSTPANGTTNASLNQQLAWQSIVNAASYNLEYSINSDMSNATSINTTSLNYTLSNLNSTTTYYWRVQAKYELVLSNWSSIWSFTTGTPPLAVPTLLSPSNNALNISTNPTLSWNAVSGATSYDLQYSKKSNMGSAVTVSNITTTSKALSALSTRTTYYWRVRAKNASQTTAWSSIWKFKTVSSGKNTIWDGEELPLANLEIYPNPISTISHFKLEVNESSFISIEITDIYGKKVASLLNDYKTFGSYELDFDATNLSNGVYFCTMIVGEEVTTTQLIIMN